METSFKAEVRRSWNLSEGDIFAKLDALRYGLTNWAKHIQRGHNGLKVKLKRKLDLLLEFDRDDDVLQEIVETKLQLNWEVNKE